MTDDDTTKTVSRTEDKTVETALQGQDQHPGAGSDGEERDRGADLPTISTDPITVTRSKLYPCQAHPGPAWTWHYEVTIPGEPHTFGGTAMGWVRWLCKSKAPGRRVVLTWTDASAGVRS